MNSILTPILKYIIKMTVYHCRQATVAKQPMDEKYITDRVLESLSHKKAEELLIKGEKEFFKERESER